MSEFVGVYREPLYSPGKVEADRAILDAVAERLREHHRVTVGQPDELPLDIPPGTTVFAMCQGPEALSRLRHWEERGHRVVNPPDAIEGCRRRSLLAAFERSGVRHPQSVLVDTGEGTRPPAWVDGGAWVKRGDVHATEAGDVVHAAERGAVEAALASLSRRGIETALVQRHVAGAVIKFYAVRGRFLCCFAGDGTPDTTLGSNAEAALGALAEQAAHSIGLEVFGGDCVLDREQSLWLIDLNDWPSYGPCRPAAADAIAAYLDAPG